MSVFLSYLSLERDQSLFAREHKMHFVLGHSPPKGTLAAQ